MIFSDPTVSFTAQPQDVTVGTDIRFTVTIADHAATMKARLYNGSSFVTTHDIVIDARLLPSGSGSGSIPLTFSTTALTPGNYTVQIDWNSTILATSAVFTVGPEVNLATSMSGALQVPGGQIEFDPWGLLSDMDDHNSLYGEYEAAKQAATPDLTQFNSSLNTALTNVKNQIAKMKTDFYDKKSMSVPFTTVQGYDERIAWLSQQIVALGGSVPS